MKAVYPGSFDPITLGHLDVIERSSKIFDSLTVLISVAFLKSPAFSSEDRKKMITDSIVHLDNVKVDIWDGLTIDYLKKTQTQILVRGVRSTVDFRQEQTMANLNLSMAGDVDTVLFCCRPEFRDVSSSSVKEMALYSDHFKKYVPDSTQHYLERLRKQK